MKKQEYANQVFQKLGITIKNHFFSGGSTVTKKGLDEIAKILISKTPQNKKQVIAEAILVLLNIHKNPKHFSMGSTVTKEFWEDVLKKI